MQKKVAKHFVKDKSLKTKEERQMSLWANIYAYISELMAELKSFYPQTALNGDMNQWIVKPGGLSRGRKIQIFDSYQQICNYAELPFLQTPNGAQTFEYN